MFSTNDKKQPQLEVKDHIAIQILDDKQQDKSLAKDNDSNDVSANNGDTPLHRIVTHCSSTVEIENYLAKRREVDVQRMAVTPNDNGNLPLDIAIFRLNQHPEWKLALDNAQHSQVSQQAALMPNMPVVAKREKHSQSRNEVANLELLAIVKYLLPMTFRSQLRPSSELLESKSIIERSDIPLGSDLARNIKLAANIANDVRRRLSGSNTHPEVNEYTDYERQVVACGICCARTRQFCCCLFCGLLTYPKETLVNYNLALITVNAQGAVREEKGNCGEYAQLAYHIMQERYPQCSVQLVSVRKGDHALILVGKGQGTVACDAWAGEIYPMSKYQDKLQGYRRFLVGQSYRNVTTTFNPRYNALEIDEPLPCALPCKALLLTFGLFAVTALVGTLNVGLELSFGKRF